MKHKIAILVVICLLWSIALAATKPDPTALVGQVGDREYNYKSLMTVLRPSAILRRGKVLTKQDSIKLNNQYWKNL